MTGALVILAVTVLAGLILYVIHRFSGSGGEAGVSSVEAVTVSDGEPEVCCGLHEVCEKGLTKAGEPVYFDDEELDRFAGRSAESYSAEEIGEFSDVLYTLLPSDLPAWGTSLTARGVELPTQLRDEWLLLLEDASRSVKSERIE